MNNSLSGNLPKAEARPQDLERFRVVNSDGISQCTLHINYRSYTASQLPPLLQRPSGYAGGSCGF